MANDNIDKLYEQFLRDGASEEEVQPEGSGSERRLQPRLKTNSTALTIKAELQVNAIDVSLSGIAFFSDYPVGVGQPLSITVGHLFNVDAEVVSCKPASKKDQGANYRVHCRFFEEEQGKYLVVAVKEMEKSNYGTKRSSKKGQQILSAPKIT